MKARLYHKVLPVLFSLVYGNLCMAQAPSEDPFITKKYAVTVAANTNRLSFRSAPQAGPAEQSAALDDCRLYLAWRKAGAAAWTETWSTKWKITARSAGILQLNAVLGDIRASVTVRKIAPQVWQFSGHLKNTGSSSVDLARFHYLDGFVAMKDAKFLGMSGVMTGPTDSFISPRATLEKMWTDMNVFWPRLAEPVEDRPNLVTSVDCGIFTPSFTNAGWFLGFTGPGTAFGEIGYKTQSTPSPFFASVMLDNIRLEPGKTRQLENCIVAYGDWQENLKFWARTCAEEMHARKVKPSMAGYCSWYQLASDVKPADLYRAAKEFRDWPVPAGGRLIQVDDGYEITTGDWRPNDKFKKDWPGLPDSILASGSVPGDYLAPIAVHQTSPIAREHPEWMQHLPDGRLAVNFSNWKQSTWFLDPDRPEAKAFVSSLFTDAKKEGWKYIKIDFTYPISTARDQYNKKKTSFESQRDLYALFRKASGEDMLLNACIGEAGRYALGYADVARLGGDISGKWATVQVNLRQLFMGASTNGLWWQGDPDVFYMRRNGLTEEENYLLTGTLGLFGGIFLTSDFPSQWSDTARERVKEFWTDKGIRRPASQYVLYTPEGLPKVYAVHYADGKSPAYRLGFYNWDNKERSQGIPLADLGLDPQSGWKIVAGNEVSAKGSETSITLNGDTFAINDQPAHSIRIIGLDNP